MSALGDMIRDYEKKIEEYEKSLQIYADKSNWSIAIQYSEFGKAQVRTFDVNKGKPWELAANTLKE